MNFGVLLSTLGGAALMASLLMSWPENKKKTRMLATWVSVAGAVLLAIGLAVLAA